MFLYSEGFPPPASVEALPCQDKKSLSSDDRYKNIILHYEWFFSYVVYISFALFDFIPWYLKASGMKCLTCLAMASFIVYTI